MSTRLAVIEEQLEQLRSLLVRSYEDTQGTAAEVLRARRDSSYLRAYDSDPLVTVRIGAYKGVDLLLDRALASVRAQTYSNWEAIVVCDGRDEEAVARIAALEDDRIRCVERPRNGPYPQEREDRWRVAGTHPFNLAVALAKGSWIAPIDQDDGWDAEHLKILLDAARETGAEVVYGLSRVVLGDGSETCYGSWPPQLGDFGFQAAIYHAGLASLLYDANSYLVEEPADWNLARRMIEAGVSFEFVDRIVTSYFVELDNPGFAGWKYRQTRDHPNGIGER